MGGQNNGYQHLILSLFLYVKLVITTRKQDVQVAKF